MSDSVRQNQTGPDADLNVLMACGDFESAWQDGNGPRAEDFINHRTSNGDPEILGQLLRLELQLRRRNGDRPTAKELLARFPNDMGLVRAVLYDQQDNVTRAPTQRPLEDTDKRDPDTVPPRLGRYRVTGKLGIGGFGVVYSAFDDELNRPVAIKVPHRRWVANPILVENYLGEARVLARLDHPHIVPVYDIGRTDDNRPLVVSRLIDGENVAKLLRRQRPTSIETANLIATIADALHYAHRQGLVHRDIKPANILMDKDGRAFLVDFGMVLREEEFGKGPTFAGTPAYMSPEQARCEGHRVDGRCDIFSLGIVFYELLTGRRPFQGVQEEVLTQIMEVEARPPRQIDDSIPRELERICLKALSKPASQRYTTAKDMAEDLRSFISHAQEVSELMGQPAGNAAEIGDSSKQMANVIPKGLRSFDASDAEFFLDLLPGPRDREGIPDAIRFWHRKVVGDHAEQPLTVGLIYGPSGCGKSSFVKAGLLPHLPSQVSSVYVEATADKTEEQLLTRLRKSCPQLFPDIGLVESMIELRRGDSLGGKKLLIVIDQFEQWLQARRGQENTELARALRQCDGSRIQCLLLVRDDFWMAVSRLMRDLEIPIVEGENAVSVDLFSHRHAKKVLTMLGRAFNALPEDRSELSATQQKFLDEAIEGLSQEGKIIPVRLSLFSEMVKGRAWTPQTLKDIGGIEGVGVTFLEESFSASTAPPWHRTHEAAARAVLKILLPEQGKDIKGNMRSYRELLEASGYADRRSDFDNMMKILSRELRLVSPSDPDGAALESTQQMATPDDQQFYQLTHDYLVPALREWLTRKQKSTRRGRAELQLAERTAIWTDKPQRRNLPNLWEWAAIRLFTRSDRWNSDERQLMRKAGRRHWTTMALWLLGLFVVGGLAWEFFGRFEADAWCHRLLENNTSELPAILKDRPSRSGRIESTLRSVIAPGSVTDAKRQLHARTGLLATDASQVTEIQNRLLDCEPADFAALREVLDNYKSGLIKDLWQIAGDDRADESRRFRAACALAKYDPDREEEWNGINRDVVEILIQQSAAVVGHWVEALRPASGHLLKPLADVLQDERRSENERVSVTKLFAHYAQSGTQAITILQERLATKIPETSTREQRVILAGQRANIAAALVQLGQFQDAKYVFGEALDPTARTFLIHRLGPHRVRFRSLLTELKNEAKDDRSDGAVRQAIVLSLGEYEEDRQLKRDVDDCHQLLLKLYREDKDSGVHSACDWLLRQHGLEKDVQKIDAEFQELDREISRTGKRPNDGRMWFVNSLGMTMVIVPWKHGAKATIEDRTNQESNRAIAVSSKEITVEQFRRFRDKHEFAKGLITSEQCPANNITFYDGVAFCRWLDEVDDIDQEQRCYEKNPENAFANRMVIRQNVYELRGYRLPFDHEWEFVCRAGTVTSFSFGDAEEMAMHFAWHMFNSKGSTHPVGTLRPNRWGLFDSHGNVSEWCQIDDRNGESKRNQSLSRPNNPFVVIDDGKSQVICGGFFSAARSNIVSTDSSAVPPSGRRGQFDFRQFSGFRVARTLR